MKIIIIKNDGIHYKTVGNINQALIEYFHEYLNKQLVDLSKIHYDEAAKSVVIYGKKKSKRTLKEKIFSILKLKIAPYNDYKTTIKNVSNFNIINNKNISTMKKIQKRIVFNIEQNQISISSYRVFRKNKLLITINVEEVKIEMEKTILKANS